MLDDSKLVIGALSQMSMSLKKTNTGSKGVKTAF